MTEGEALRREIVGLSQHKNSRRYSAELRGRVVAWAQQRLHEGGSTNAVCRDLDVGEPTLRKFLGGATGVVAKSVGFARVQVAPSKRKPAVAAVPRGLVLRGPRGVIVEGLSLEELARLLQRLSCSA